MIQDQRDDQDVAREAEMLSETGRARRKMVRAGMKLAFVAPLVSTFLAEDAMAAGSNLSCYAAGHACDGATKENCCSGLTCTASVCT